MQEAQTAEMVAAEREHMKAICHKILSTCSRIYDLDSEVEDMVALTLSKALWALPEFKGESTLGSWVFRIAVNTCYNRIEQVNRACNVVSIHAMEPDVLKLMPLITYSDSGEDPVQHCLTNELIGSIREGIQMLKADLREVLLLHLAGLEYTKIAQKQNVSVGTVKSRLHRARKKLLEICPWATEVLAELAG